MNAGGAFTSFGGGPSGFGGRQTSSFYSTRLLSSIRASERNHRNIPKINNRASFKCVRAAVAFGEAQKTSLQSASITEENMDRERTLLGPNNGVTDSGNGMKKDGLTATESAPILATKLERHLLSSSNELNENSGDLLETIESNKSQNKMPSSTATRRASNDKSNCDAANSTIQTESNNRISSVAENEAVMGEGSQKSDNTLLKVSKRNGRKERACARNSVHFCDE